MAARVVPPINLCLYYNPICMLKDNLLVPVWLIVAMVTTWRNHRRERKWCLRSRKISARSQERQDYFSLVALLLPHTLHVSYSVNHFPTLRLYLRFISHFSGSWPRRKAFFSYESVLSISLSSQLWERKRTQFLENNNMREAGNHQMDAVKTWSRKIS